MPNPTGMINRTDSPDSPQSLAISNSENSRWHNQHIDPNLLRKPDGWVFVFSIAPRDIFRNHLLVRTNVPKLQPGQDYVLVARIPNPFQEKLIDQSSGDVIAKGTDAWKIAADYCNPSNLSKNQDIALNEKAILNAGNNLSHLGVFWVEGSECKMVEEKDAVTDKTVMVPVPPKAALDAARARLESYFRSRLEIARTLAISNPKELESEINQDFHLAADYFDEEFPWHRKVERKVECSTCGMRIVPGKKFHLMEYGKICVQPTVEGWKSAVNAGVKTKDEVPDDFKWWSDSPKPEAKKATDKANEPTT